MCFGFNCITEIDRLDSKEVMEKPLLSAEFDVAD